MGEDEKGKMAAEEEEEVVVVGRGGKARTGQPLLQASQPALSPKRQRLLGGAERKAETVPRPAVEDIGKGQSEGMD